MTVNNKGSRRAWRIGEGGQIHRWRCKEYINGDTYEGEVVDGKKDGFGTLRSNSSKYDGDFKNDMFHGFGVLTWTDEDSNGGTHRFEGHFRNGKKEGSGVYINAREDEFQGDWKDGIFEGEKNVLLKANGDKLEGNFVRGHLTGDATISFANGDQYVGAVSYDIFDGIGRLNYRDGTASFSGTYKRGLKHGTGIRIFRDGSRYDGDFVDDEMEGYGEMKYANGDEYIGEWMDSFPHGKGTLVCTGDNGAVKEYKGEFLKGVMYGAGRIKYVDGSYYEGDLKAKTDKDTYSHGKQYPKPDGLKHGYGIRVWVSGNRFEGNWVNGEMDEGTFIDVIHHSVYKGKFIGNKKDGYGIETWSEAEIEEVDVVVESTPEEDSRLAFTKKEEKKYYRDPCMGWLHKKGNNKKKCKYVGHYRAGVFHGEGIFTAPDGRFYEGQWEKGKQNGWGRSILLPNEGIGVNGSLYRGFYYEGQWMNGVREGQGKLCFLDGTSIEGLFHAGHPDGEVTIRYPRNKKRKTDGNSDRQYRHAIYKHGILLKCMSEL